MISSLIIALYFNFINQSYENWEKIVFGSLLTTIVWIAATYFTPPDDDKTLRRFVKKVNPGGPGWAKFPNSEANESLACSKWNFMYDFRLYIYL